MERNMMKNDIIRETGKRPVGRNFEISDKAKTEIAHGVPPMCPECKKPMRVLMVGGRVNEAYCEVCNISGTM
jgi:hypothetical protein